MRFSQEEVLAQLNESGRDKWNVRKMAALRKDGFLPSLKRGVQPGTNSPYHFWDETDVEQVFEVYDWWDECGGDRGTLALVLWLSGYEVPLHLLRSIYVPTIESYLQKLTGGNTDPDDVLDKVSEIVVRWMRKMKYTPGLAEQRQKMKREQNFGMEQMEAFIELVLDTLAVPDPESTIHPFQSILEGTPESSEVAVDEAVDEEFSARYQQVTKVVREIFSLRNILDVINSATLEQWDQALEDYVSILIVFKDIAKISTKGDTAGFDETILRNWIIMGASLSIAPLLSARYRGYGKWIDKAFENIHEFLSDPAIQEEMFARARARWARQEEIQDSEKPDWWLVRLGFS